MASPTEPPLELLAPEVRSRVICLRIEGIIENFVTHLASGECNGGLLKIARTRGNSQHNSFSGAIVAGTHTQLTRLTSHVRFARLLAVLAEVHSMLLQNRFMSGRQLFYTLKHLFDTQSQLEETILCASSSLNVPRYFLGLGSASNGVVAGKLEISNRTARIDCTKVGATGWPIPGDINQVLSLAFVSDAQHIIVVEKYGIFQRLCEDGIFRHFPVILVCGKGYPSVSTRAFVTALKRQLNVPAFALTDCNPEGFMIFLIYKMGSIRSSVEGSRFVIDLKWLGLRPSQIKAHEEKYSIGTLDEPFTDRDVSLLATIRRRLNGSGNSSSEYSEELAEMERMGKYELQWLYGHPAGISYVSSTFIPRAIIRGNY